MKQTHKQRATISLVMITLTVAFVFGTNPQNLPVSLLLVLPALIAGGVYVTTHLLLDVFSDLPKEKVKLTSLAIAGVPTFIILLGSVGRLSVQDLLLAVLLIGGFTWYVKRLKLAAINQPSA